MLSVASCYRNWDKLQPDEPLGLNADFTFGFKVDNICRLTTEAIFSQNSIVRESMVNVVLTSVRMIEE